MLEDLYSVIGGRKNKKSTEYPIDMKKEKAIEGIVSLTKLEELLERHPYDLSGGEQQRLALAKVLLLRPKILLMDEPTKGMDAEYKAELGKILEKTSAAWNDHFYDFARCGVCGRVCRPCGTVF